MFYNEARLPARQVPASADARIIRGQGSQTRHYKQPKGEL
jgi:hypothetical protein